MIVINFASVVARKYGEGFLKPAPSGAQVSLYHILCLRYAVLERMKILDGQTVGASDVIVGCVAVNAKSRVMIGLIDDQSCQQTYLIGRKRPILDNALNASF